MKSQEKGVGFVHLSKQIPPSKQPLAEAVEFDVDGIRLDTTPHMRYDFLKEIQDGDRRCKFCGALGRN